MPKTLSIFVKLNIYYRNMIKSFEFVVKNCK